MNNTPYNPDIHHRHSIRLKGHDYAGGGVYFVTICAHRDAGNIFVPEAVKAMVAREWVAAAASGGAGVGVGLVSTLPHAGDVSALPHDAHQGGRHEAYPYAIMPDHFHALIRMPRGPALGDVICAFKSLVVHEYIAKVKAGEWPRFAGNIWHRNYYEMIVRDEEAEQNIARYIRMNPWRCVMDFGNGLRGMGNPSLWNTTKIGVLASRRGVWAGVGAGLVSALPHDARQEGRHEAYPYIGGFHSPMERAILDQLLAAKHPVIWCPAWGLDGTFPAAVLDALENNRMLILEMRDCSGNLAAAEQRNRFVMEHADSLWLPYVAPGGMLERLIKELNVREKILAQ
jgi:putative transposase